MRAMVRRAGGVYRVRQWALSDQWLGRLVGVWSIDLEPCAARFGVGWERGGLAWG